MEGAGVSEIAGLKQALGSRQNLHEKKRTDPRENGSKCKETEGMVRSPIISNKD
jgi:hypothetical protein